MNNLDHISESLETIFCVKILIFFDADSGDPGWKKFGSGMEKIRVSGIRDKHPRIRYTDQYGIADSCLIFILIFSFLCYLKTLAGSVQSYLGGEQDGPAWMLLSVFTAFVPCSQPGFVLEHFNTAVQNQQASLSFLVCIFVVDIKDPDPAFLSES
jgi:hypothetical protein